MPKKEMLQTSVEDIIVQGMKIYMIKIYVMK